MNISDSIKMYNQIFRDKQQFIYFFYDMNLPHFEKLLQNQIPLFSSMHNSLDHRIIQILDGCATQYNAAKTREEREKAIHKNEIITTILTSSDSIRSSSYYNKLYK